MDFINELLKKVKEEIGENNYKNYFENIEFDKEQNDILYFKVPNQFLAKHIQTKYSSIIENILKNITEKKYKISFFEKKQNTKRLNLKEKELNKNLKEIIHSLNPSYTFDNFIIGESNKFTYQACKNSTLEKNFGKSFNPIFIYSKTGLGKTHLLQACGHKCLELGKKVIYKTAKDFMKDYQTALLNNKFESFNNDYKDCNLLLIDDIQFLGNTEKIQEEFFHIFNDIIQKNGQIIMTSDVAPKDLNGIEDRLKSRFSNGIIANISVPDLDTRKAIIKKKCEVHEIDLNNEILNTIANYIGESIREIEGIITRINAMKLLSGQMITLELVKNLIKEYINEEKQNIDIDDIFQMISKEFNIKISEIKSNSKKQEIVKAKRIVIYLAKELISNSTTELAKNFQMKDHSSISHNIKKTQELIKKDNEFKNLIENIKNKIINLKSKDF